MHPKCTKNFFACGGQPGICTRSQKTGVTPPSGHALILCSPRRLCTPKMADQKEEPRFVDTISCHAWNADRTKVALCPGNNQVLIYAIKGGDLAQRTLEATLEEVWRVSAALPAFPSFAICLHPVLSCSNI